MAALALEERCGYRPIVRRGERHHRQVNRGSVDLYASSVHWQVAESYTGLAPGPHTIVAIVLGTKDDAAKSTNVIIDAFVVI